MEIKSLFTAATRFLRTLWGHVPLTLAGVILAGLALLLRHHYALEHHDYLLLILTTGILTLITLSLIQLIVCVTIYFTSKSQGIPTITGTTRTPFETGFRIRKIPLLAAINVSVEWLQPGFVQAQFEADGTHLAEVVIAQRRTCAESVTRRVRFTDVFGLVKFEHVATFAQKIWITPSGGVLSAYETLRLFSSGDEISHPEGQPVGDLIEMKPYIPGDPVKRILWRVYAKNRKLLVRMPETAIARRKKTFAYLITGNHDEPTAATAWQALEKGVLGADFLFATDGVAPPTSDTAEALDQIVVSSKATRPADQLEHFFSDHPDANKANCLVFAPPEEGAWLEALHGLSKKFAQNLQILITVPGFSPSVATAGWKQIFLKAQAPDEDRSGRLRRLYRNLRSQGFQVSVIDQHEQKLVSPLELE